MAAPIFKMKKRLLALSILSAWGLVPHVHAQEAYEDVEFRSGPVCLDRFLYFISDKSTGF